MDRNEIVKRLENLRQQKAQSEAIFEQVKANLNAIHGAIQFAEDVLKDMPEMTCSCGDDPRKGCIACPSDRPVIVPVSQADGAAEDLIGE